MDIAVKRLYISMFIPGVLLLIVWIVFLFDSVLKLDWTLYPILMCVIGGTGTITGPLLGAFFINTLFSVADIYFVQMHPILAGLLIIIVMKFMPGGLIGLIQKKQ